MDLFSSKIRKSGESKLTSSNSMEIEQPSNVSIESAQVLNRSLCQSSAENSAIYDDVATNTSSESSSEEDSLVDGLSNSAENANNLSVSSTRTQLVEELRCPISHMIMRDPVFTCDGETYEKEEIERWLKQNQTSPATNVKLADKTLKPNIALKKAITTFLEQHPHYNDELYFSRSLEQSFIDACKTSMMDQIKEAEMIKTLKKLLQQERRFIIHRFENGGSILHVGAQFSSIATFKVIEKAWKSYHKASSKKIVSLREGLTEKDYDGWTPFHIAAYINKDYEVCKEIIRRLRADGLEKVKQLRDSQKKSKEGDFIDTHFLFAVRSEEFEVMAALLKLGANIEAKEQQGSKYQGSNALHIACSKGLSKFVEFLVENGAALNARTGTHPADFGPLHFAARGGHVDVAKLLLDKGADIDLKCNPNGCIDWTPLHLAARNSRLNAVQLLVQRGADVNAQGSEEKMGPGTFGPVYLAVFYGHLECSKYLLDQGARLIGTGEELHLLHAAVRNNQMDMIQYLLKRGASINAIDWNSKQTALHIAAASGSIQIVKYLINYQMESQMEAMAQMEPEEQLKHFIDLNAEDKKGNTPLHEAAINGHKEVCSLLVVSGACWKSKNATGKTAVEEAIRNNKKDIADEIQHEVKKMKSMRQLLQSRNPTQDMLVSIHQMKHTIQKQQEQLQSQSDTIQSLQQKITALEQRAN